jgi:hypothetical protein
MMIIAQPKRESSDFFGPVDDNPFIVSGMDMADAAAHVCIDFVLIVSLTAWCRSCNEYG